MKSFKKLFLLLMIGSMIFSVGCVSIARKTREKVEKDEEEIEENLDALQLKIKNMTLDEKIGQLMMLGFEEKNIDDELKQEIKDLKPSGLILFKRNIESIEQNVNLINDIKNYNKSLNNIPLFISTDEEGGDVSRMPKEIVKNPSAGEIGKLADMDLVRGFANHIGSTLNKLGVNMNNGPVLDVRYNPNNDITRTRTFNKDEKMVAEYGLVSIEEYKKENIISVVKHFPGHGSTDIDSHYTLPIVTKTREELLREDIYPFKVAIDNGVDGIMVSHIVYRDIDNKPASVSSKVINDLLIEELGYKNLIISDDMTMGAITNGHEPESAGVEFLKAGGDIALFCHGDTIGYEFRAKLKEELKKGTITEKEIDNKVYKVLKMKEKYEIEDTSRTMPNVKQINEELDKLKNHENIKQENQKIKGM